VSALFDEYYTSIRKDLEDLGERDLLRAAGIGAFFRAMDRSDGEITGAIQEAFGISSEAFWEAARRLHNLEVLDMYEDKVVRTSDQVLATYLFYLAFFKEQALDFSALLDRFFPRLRHRLVDAINPVLNAFDSEAIVEAMRPHVDSIWKSMEEAVDEEDLLHLMDVFWFLKQTDTLPYVQRRIEEMKPKPVDLSDIDFKASSNIPSPSLLSLLSAFRDADDNTFRMTLALLLSYLMKWPEELPQVLHLLTKRFGFRHTSYLRGFSVQRAVIEVLWERAQDGKDELFSKLFLAVAEQYSHARFYTTESKGARAITMIDFQLPPISELFELRRTIWKRLLQLYQAPAFRGAVLGVLHKYSASRYEVSLSEVIAYDAEMLLPFVESELHPGSLRHCLIVQEYLDPLEDHKVSFNKELHNQFRSETFLISELLTLDWPEKQTLGMGYGEYQRYKKDRGKEYFAHYAYADYERFFEQCLGVQTKSDTPRKAGGLMSRAASKAVTRVCHL